MRFWNEDTTLIAVIFLSLAAVFLTDTIVVMSENCSVILGTC